MKMIPSRNEVVPVMPPVPMVLPMPMPQVAATPGTPSALLSWADHLLQHARLFSMVWLGAVVLGLAYLLIAAPVYRADALVQVDNRTPRNLASNQNPTQTQPEGPAGFIQGEIEILRSRETMSKAIAQTRADVDIVVDNRLPLIGSWYARTVGRRAGTPAPPPLDWPLLQGFSWGGEKLRVSDLRVPRAQYGEPLWLLANDKGWTLHDDTGRQVAAGGIGRAVQFTLGTGAGSLQVDQLEALPGTRFKLVANDPSIVYDDLLRSLRVEEAGRQSGVIRLSLNDTDPRFATGFLEALTSAYLDQRLSVQSGEAGRALRFLETQLPAVKRDLDRAEEALNQYRTGTNTINVSQENENSLRRIADLERERVGIELRRQQVAQRYTSAYPEAVSLQRQLGTVNAELSKLRGEMRQSPRQEKDLVRLQRDVQVNTQLYTTLLNNAQELRVAQAGNNGNARLVDPAGVLSLPVRPRASMVLSVAAALGLVLGLAAVLLSRMVRPTVGTAEDLERHSGVQALASIPDSARQQALMGARRLWRTRAHPRLLSLNAPSDPAVESLRSLRNSTAYRHGDGEHHSVLITAATGEAGKTFVAANLAVLKAATGRRVLLIDLDLRAPRLHTYFGVDRARTGLIDVVAERCSANEAIVADVLPGLDLLLPGRLLGNPGELLMQPRFEALINELSRRYGHVVIDSPPVLPVGDALALGRMTDATYLVVRSEVNTFREVRDAMRRLESAGVGVDGVILNGVKRARLAQVPFRPYEPRDIDVRVAT
jgi:tyrosine-protein kinase Etk/Wzc